MKPWLSWFPLKPVPISISITSVFALPAPKAIQPSGLSKLGHQTEWLSCVGDDEFGRFLLSRIRAEGVSVSHVRLDAHAPTGLMAKRFNPSSETEIFYYRSGSAASQMNETLISEKSFEDVGIVHMTGITPVLSPSCLRLTRGYSSCPVIECTD